MPPFQGDLRLSAWVPYVTRWNVAREPVFNYVILIILVAVILVPREEVRVNMLVGVGSAYDLAVLVDFFETMTSDESTRRFFSMLLTTAPQKSSILRG